MNFQDDLYWWGEGGGLVGSPKLDYLIYTIEKWPKWHKKNVLHCALGTFFFCFFVMMDWIWFSAQHVDICHGSRTLLFSNNSPQRESINNSLHPSYFTLQVSSNRTGRRHWRATILPGHPRRTLREMRIIDVKEKLKFD